MTARYLVRVDDICPTMDWASWERLERLFVDRGVKPILAVVPDNRDERLSAGPPAADFWERVREWQARGWTIGLHGYQHRYETNDGGLVGINAYSEFSGLPIEIQRAKLRAALDILRTEGIDARVWVAPAHSFDRTTVAVLKEMGIDAISDGFYVRAVRRLGCYWIPQQLWRLRRMPFGTWTVCLHPNTMTAEQLAALDAGLRSVSDRLVGFDDVIDRKRIGAYSAFDAAFHRLWRLAIRVRASA